MCTEIMGLDRAGGSVASSLMRLKEAGKSQKSMPGLVDVQLYDLVVSICALYSS